MGQEGAGGVEEKEARVRIVKIVEEVVEVVVVK
jgi:hypothetical protein